LKSLTAIPPLGLEDNGGQLKVASLSPLYSIGSIGFYAICAKQWTKDLNKLGDCHLFSYDVQLLVTMAPRAAASADKPRKENKYGKKGRL